ncbi:MAG: hypothetical protein ICV68_05860 [Pyrinomonadaceae bacterium]|nr:hypothetical protein [Pyrinomonadaceae bacterium]
MWNWQVQQTLKFWQQPNLPLQFQARLPSSREFEDEMVVDFYNVKTLAFSNKGKRTDFEIGIIPIYNIQNFLFDEHRFAS